MKILRKLKVNSLTSLSFSLFSLSSFTPCTRAPSRAVLAAPPLHRPRALRRCRPFAAPAAAALLPRCAAPSPSHSSAHAPSLLRCRPHDTPAIIASPHLRCCFAAARLPELPVLPQDQRAQPLSSSCSPIKPRRASARAPASHSRRHCRAAARPRRRAAPSARPPPLPTPERLPHHPLHLPGPLNRPLLAPSSQNASATTGAAPLPPPNATPPWRPLFRPSSAPIDPAESFL